MSEELSPRLAELIDTLVDLKNSNLSRSEKESAKRLIVQMFYDDIKPRLESIATVWANLISGRYRWEEDTRMYDAVFSMTQTIADIVGCPQSCVRGEVISSDVDFSNSVRLQITVNVMDIFVITINSTAPCPSA